MIPNQILSQSLLREVNRPEKIKIGNNRKQAPLYFKQHKIFIRTYTLYEGPFSKPTIPKPSFQERDIISRLNDEDNKFDSMRLKHAPNNIQKMNELMDLKKKRDIKPTEEDLDYQKLLKQLEYATAKNAQFKQDLNMIDAALEQLDPKKKMLIGTDIEKKFAYESLRTKRMQIRDKEKVFIDQLQQFHDYYAFNERNRIEKGIVNNDFLQSKQQKIRDLKLQHEQLDYDKTNFLDQFDKIRTGYSIKAQPYFTQVGASSLGGNPSYLAMDYDLGRVRDKLQDDQRKIEQMKSFYILFDFKSNTNKQFYQFLQTQNKFIQMTHIFCFKHLNQSDNLYYFTRNHLPVDPEEAFGSNKVNFKQEIKYLMETNKYAPSTEDKYTKLKQIRENLEKLGAEKGLNVSKVKLQFIEETPESIQEYQSTLRDIENLRQDYIQSGGSDAEFLMNLQNLEMFYKQTRFNPVNKDIIRIQQGLPISSTDPPGFYYNSSVQNPNSGAKSMYPPPPPGMQNNSFAAGGNPQIAGNQPQQQPQKVDINELSKPEETITNHPIYDYLPESFKKQVVDLEQKNKSMKYDLKSVHVPPVIDLPSNMVDGKSLNRTSNDPQNSINTDEQMLNYVRGQESELLLNMSRLNPNQVEYSAKHSQFLQVQQIKSSLERSILDKKVKNALSGMNQSMNPSAQGNVSIVYGGGVDQSMNMAHLSRASTLYSPNEGFTVRWDWIGSLPINYARMKLNFGIFRKGDNFFAYRDSETFQTEQETYRSNKCIILQKDILRDVQPFPDTVLYCEFQGFQHTSEGVPSRPEIVGWSMHELFDYNGQLNPGKYRLPFYSKVFQPNELFNEGLPYMSNSALFIRICLPMDPYFDVDTTVLLQNEYKVQDLHVRKKRILKLDENSNQYVADTSNRYMYAGDKNMTIQDPNQSSMQNYDQSTMIPNQSNSGNQKPIDFSQLGPQSTLNKTSTTFNDNHGQSKPDLNATTNNLQKSIHSRQQSQLPSGILSQGPTKRNITIPPSYLNSEISGVMSSTSIDVGGVQKEVPRSLKIRLIKLMNVKQEVKTLQIRSVIFTKNEFLMTRSKNPSADNTKLDDVTVSKTNEIQMNVKMDQDVDWKEILQKQTKKDLEKIVFYCAIFKCVVGKEDELIGWLLWPLFKAEGEQKMVNTGVFTTNIFKKPAQKPPFGEKKEKADVQMQFEIEAVGSNQGDTRQATMIAKSVAQINDDESKMSSQHQISTKNIDMSNPLDNKKKLVVDLIGLQKYTLVKNDLQYKMEVVKEAVQLQDENGHKCTDKQDIKIREKGKDMWKFDNEQRFEIGQQNIVKNFDDSTKSKGFIMITIMTLEKSEIVGIAKVPLFQTSGNLSEGRNKQELIKIEKNGTEKPQRYILDYYEFNKKVYDLNKGFKVIVHELSNYREKFDVTYQFSVMNGKQKMLGNQNQQCLIHGEEFVTPTPKDKKVVFKDIKFVSLNLEKVRDQYRRQLDEIFLLFDIVIDKSEGKGEDIEETYAWYAHRLFVDYKVQSGKYTEQIWKLPIEIEVQPIDPKKAKKYLIKLEFEIQEEVGTGQKPAEEVEMVSSNTVNLLQRSATKNPAQKTLIPQAMKSSVNVPPPPSGDNSSNKFNIYVEKLNKIKFKNSVVTKLAIILVDDIFPNDSGQPCSFTDIYLQQNLILLIGEPTKPTGDFIELNEEYDIDLDIEALKKKHPKQLDQFFFFINILDDNSKCLYWFLSKIFEKGDLKIGLFTESLFEPPVPAKLSNGIKSGKKSTAQITYEIKKGHSDESFDEA